MSEINIKLSSLKTVANDLEQLQKALSQPQNEVRQCALKDYISVSSLNINAVLKGLSEDISIEKEQMAKLSSALKEVVRLYENTEKQILDQGGKGKVTATESGSATEAEKKGAIENTLEILEEILGHDAVSFISAFVEELAKLNGLGTGLDITAGILDALNYMIDDLQDGATLNSLYANLIVSAASTLLAMGAGIAVEAAVTSAITAACAGATGGVGAAIAPFAAIIGKAAGAGASIVTGHAVDAFNEADWDRDGESNRDEVKNVVETILDWRYPLGDNHTFYLPEGI